MSKAFRYIAIIALTMTGLACGKDANYPVDFSSEVQLSAESSDIVIKANITSNESLEGRGLIFSVDTAVLIDDYYYSNNSVYGVVESGKILDQTNQPSKDYVLKGLRPLTVYYYRLFSIYNGAIKYSELKSFTTDCPGLGCGPAGGQIIYLDANGGGIEVAANYSTEIRRWGCNLNVGTEDGIGTGAQNTSDIINTCGINTLARLCDNYEQNGFSDYYMPSIDELELIYKEVYKKSNNPYGWYNGIYFSSSESSVNAAKVWNFPIGTSADNFSKSAVSYGTIPVRSF